MSITQDSQHAVSRANRPPLGDPPVDIASNLAPATIEVTGNLAEDSVIAGVMDIADGDNTVAIFANPFSGGSEEMLYIDEQDTLRWARHVNPVDDVEPGGLSGWSTDAVVNHAGEVVVAVTPDGSVWAITTSVGKNSQGQVLELVADPAAPGGQRWHGAQTLDLPTASTDTLHILPVYYCNDRPATPVVFVDVPDHSSLYWLMATNAPAEGEQPQPPWRAASFPYDSSERRASKVAGIDSPDVEFSQGPTVDAVRLYSLVGTSLFMTTYDPRTTTRTRVAIGDYCERLVGPWTYPTHAGVVFEARWDSLPLTYLCFLFPHESFGTFAYSETLEIMDCELDDLRVWQDAEGLAHLYGRDSEGSLKVVHQVGWRNAPGWEAVPGVLREAVWESHEVDLDGPRPALPHHKGSPLVEQLVEHQADTPLPVCTTRPLVASVARYDIDAYPDDMPSQHVMAQGAEPGETCAIYTQDLLSALWHQERMRLVPESLPKPYVVPRYEATLTVKNALGTPVANCEVSLTADAPIDLEVDGRFYRTGTITPVRLATNGSGQVTLRVVARSLAVPQMHVTVSGMAQSLSVQMAADVHKFLSGNGTLPNHSDGFTAEAVESATKPDGQPLFPGIRKAADETDWPPSAQDVVTWCKGVFAVDSGSPLPTGLRAGLADDEDVVAFSFQTRDPRRPALESFTSREQLDARRQILGEQGVVDELEGWFGDVWQGIQEGVVDLAQATVNLLDQTIELIVTLADEVEAVFVCAWQDVVSAAHAVEAVFVAIEAKIEEVVDWLKWAFGFADALKTAQALRTVMNEAPRLVSPLLAEIGTVADGFFIEKEAEVRSYFEAMKATLGGQSLSSLQGPTATVPTDSQPSPQVAVAGDQAQSPHAQWFLQQVTRVGSSSTPAQRSSAGGPVSALVEEVFTMFGETPAFESLSTALKDLTDVFAEFFSGKDPGSVAASQLVDILDFAENVIIGILQLLDELANDVLTWSGDALEYVATLLDTPLTDVAFLELIWDFVVEQSGLDPADFPLTVGMLGGFLAGYPFTVITKAITGQAPFANGGIPVPPALGEPWDVGNDVSDELLMFQAFQGLTQTLDLVLDGWLDLNSMSRGAFPLPAPVTQGFAAVHFVAYVIGDYPWFWGYAPFTENKLPYFRYILTFFFNMYDLAMAVDNGTLAEMMEGDGENVTPEQKELRETVMMLQTAAFGWIRIGINLAEYLRIPNMNDGAEATWYDTWNLWINLTAYIQTATGFVRYVFKRVEPETPAFYPVLGALVVKTAIDLAGDIYSGVCTVVQPMREMFDRPTIDWPTDGRFHLADAYLWQPYESEIVPASGGWPPYSWSSVDSNNEPLALAAGLELVTPNYDADLGRTVRVAGTPSGLSAYDGYFWFHLDDGYGPSSSARAQAVLVVQPAPVGIPTADFTITPETAQAPATIQFTDASTASPTSWTWDLDDGAGQITVENPVAVYTFADTYTITMVAINEKGHSEPVTRQLVVAAPAGTPVADFTFTDNPRSGAEMEFTSQTTGGPTSYLWDFGDGRNSTERNPVLTYESGGDYVVSLVCANASGWGVRTRHLVSVHWA